jgi:hypothetical protein
MEAGRMQDRSNTWAAAFCLNWQLYCCLFCRRDVRGFIIGPESSVSIPCPKWSCRLMWKCRSSGAYIFKFTSERTVISILCLQLPFEKPPQSPTAISICQVCTLVVRRLSCTNELLHFFMSQVSNICCHCLVHRDQAQLGVGRPVLRQSSTFSFKRWDWFFCFVQLFLSLYSISLCRDCFKLCIHI